LGLGASRVYIYKTVFKVAVEKASRMYVHLVLCASSRK
jgi:hypothetical protein